MDWDHTQAKGLKGSPGSLFFYPWERQFDRLITPFEEFIHRQTTSGIVLMFTTLVALIIANSPLSDAYRHILHTNCSISLGYFNLRMDLAHWINEGLMVFFFLLVGCEIKREVLVGDLSNVRVAALPIVAAIGGVIMPAVIYRIFNPAGEGANGWGIPMATDIAFCVGALVLLGKRVPAALTLFLVSLAIVDDLAAVVVIALFYTAEINIPALWLALLMLFSLMLFNLAGVRRLIPYGIIGFLMWLALLSSGIHAAVCGVLLAFCLPAHSRHDTLSFAERMKQLVGDFKACCPPTQNALKNMEQHSLLLLMMEEVRLTETPLQRVQNALHIPTSLIVIPLFAFANAGIAVSSDELIQVLSNNITIGIILGLVLGKFLGITGFSWIVLKTGFAKLPEGMKMVHLAGGALLAGIGFTMSIFIAELSFSDNDAYLNTAKAAIILSSLLAGIVGVIWLGLCNKFLNERSGKQ